MSKSNIINIKNLDNNHKNLIKKLKIKLKFFRKPLFAPDYDNPAYYASYSNGIGLQYIKKKLNCKINKLLFIAYTLKDIFNSLVHNEIKVLNYKKKINAKKIVFTWAFKKNFNKNGSLEDRYLNINSRKLKNIQWFVLFSEKTLPKKIDNNIIIIQTLNKKRLNFLLLFKTIASNLKYLFISPQYFLFSISSHNFLSNKILETLKEIIKSPVKICLFIYEAQPFQNKIIKHFKTINIKTLGYIHSPPLALPTNLIKKKYSPSKIFVNGKDQKKCLIKLGWEKKEITTIPSTRFLKKKKNFSNQIFLPITIKSPTEILKNLEFLIINFKLNINQFTTRNHPAALNSRAHNNLILQINDLKKKYYNFKNNLNFKKYSIFIGASGAIIEALERNCKVIQITEIPILDFYSKYFWNNIKSKKINNNIFTYSILKKGNLISFGNKPRNLDMFFGNDIT